MKKEAEDLNLELVPHKETWLIKTIEEIQSVLDEQIVNI